MPTLQPASKRYEEVKQVLRDRIDAGEYQPGDRLPSGHELEREFGVSGITIRRALRDLETEGLLRSRQGLGTFVSDQPRINRPLNPPFINSLGDEMRRAGVTPALKVLSFELVQPPTNVSMELELAAGEAAYRHERLILADGEAVGLDTTYIPRSTGEVIGPEMDHEFLMPLLERHGIAYGNVTYKLHATSLTAADARKFGLSPGVPMLSMAFRPCDMRSKPIFLGHLLTRAPWFSFEFSVANVPPARGLPEPRRAAPPRQVARGRS